MLGLPPMLLLRVPESRDHQSEQWSRQSEDDEDKIFVAGGEKFSLILSDIIDPFDL